jgi:hypothetical protein
LDWKIKKSNIHVFYISILNQSDNGVIASGFSFRATDNAKFGIRNH